MDIFFFNLLTMSWFQYESYIFAIFSPVSVDDLKRSILQADIEIDNVKMNKYITWVFQSETDPLPQDKVIERLRNGNVARIGRKL
jgi:hypothetical protein